MRSALGLVAVLIISPGCGQAPSAKLGTKPVVSPDVLALTGPGGKVALGDALDQAKKAFPAPKGAQQFDRAMNFAILGTDGWAWATEATSEGFEAAVKDGKVVDMARTLGKGSSEPAASIASLGQPTRKAEGQSASVYVWESGDSARIIVEMKKSALILAGGTMMLVGKKEDLNLLNYRADDPSVFVKQMDSAAAQMSSPEIKKAMEDAKARAKTRR